MPAGRGTYGARRVHAELQLGIGITVNKNTIEVLMRRAGLQGIPKRKGKMSIKITVTTDDLVNRQFNRSQPNVLWVTDITEHPTPCMPVVVATPPVAPSTSATRWVWFARWVPPVRVTTMPPQNHSGQFSNASTATDTPLPPSTNSLSRSRRSCTVTTTSGDIPKSDKPAQSNMR